MTQYATYILDSRDYKKFQPVEVLSTLSEKDDNQTQVRRLHDNVIAWVYTWNLLYPDEEVPK